MRPLTPPDYETRYAWITVEVIVEDHKVEEVKGSLYLHLRNVEILEENRILLDEPFVRIIFEGEIEYEDVFVDSDETAKDEFVHIFSEEHGIEHIFTGENVTYYEK